MLNKKKMNKPLRAKRYMTVRATIRALGGTSQVAKWAGVSMPAVSNWIAEGFIPPGYHMQFHLAVEHRGDCIHPSVFGLDETGRPLRARRAV